MIWIENSVVVFALLCFEENRNWKCAAVCWIAPGSRFFSRSPVDSHVTYAGDHVFAWPGRGSISLAAPPRRIVIYKQVSQFSRFANLVSASFFASLLCVINVWLLIWRCTGGAAARPHFAMALSIVRPARETDWNARDANLELFSARRPTRCELLFSIRLFAHNSWLIKVSSERNFRHCRDEFSWLFLAGPLVRRMIDFLGEFHLRQFAFSSRPFSPWRVAIVFALSQNCHICLSEHRMWDLTLDCLIDKCFCSRNPSVAVQIVLNLLIQTHGVIHILISKKTK